MILFLYEGGKNYTRSPVPNKGFSFKSALYFIVDWNFYIRKLECLLHKFFLNLEWKGDNRLFVNCKRFISRNISHTDLTVQCVIRFIFPRVTHMSIWNETHALVNVIILIKLEILMRKEVKLYLNTRFKLGKKNPSLTTKVIDWKKICYNKRGKSLKGFFFRKQRYLHQHGWC